MAKPPLKFKVPHLESYQGKIDPIDRLATIGSMTFLLNIDDALMYCRFFMTLKELALGGSLDYEYEWSPPYSLSSSECS